MAIKRILVHLGQDARARERFGVAADLARSFQARLIGLFQTPDRSIPGYVMDELPVGVFEELSSADKQALTAAKQTFESSNKAAGLTLEWRTVIGSGIEPVESAARCCDLTIVGQKDPEGGVEGVNELAEQLVLTAGTPILVIPYAGDFEVVGRRILVAWDGTREAARAIHDALPLLVRAEEVSVGMVNPPGDSAQAGADITAYLVEHGVSARAHVTVSRLPEDETAVLGPRSVGIGDLLLSAAFDFSADMLVMGAYGHSRLRELVLGGTTRYVLHHMTLPVLMSR